MLASGIMRGLTKADTQTMTTGQWVDYIIEYNNIEYEANQDDDDDTTGTNRMATQKDFDNF
jgi:hypothetical protein